MDRRLNHDYKSRLKPTRWGFLFEPSLHLNNILPQTALTTIIGFPILNDSSRLFSHNIDYYNMPRLTSALFLASILCLPSALAAPQPDAPNCIASKPAYSYSITFHETIAGTSVVGDYTTSGGTSLTSPSAKQIFD